MAKPKTQKTSERTYPGIHFFQRESGPQLVVFVAPVGEILEWAVVQKLAPSPKNRGPQREQNEARVVAIAKFLTADAHNTIPTAVVLAFEKNKASFIADHGEARGMLKVSPGAATMVDEEPRLFAATVVDGQHRLYGMNVFDPQTVVAVVGLLDVDKVEKAFQFLVINNKSSRVPQTHVKALMAAMAKTKLEERLRGARVALDVEGIRDVDLVNTERDSPFFHTIAWTLTKAKMRMVPARAVEMSLLYLGSLGIPEYEDRDTRRSVFLAIWKTVRKRWGKFWEPKSRLVSKVGIYCLTRFVADHITSWADKDSLSIEVSNLEDIQGETDNILKYMDGRFWEAPWAEKASGGFDTNQGRDRVMAALTQLYRNGRRDIEWYTDIEIIERTEEEEEEKPRKRTVKKGARVKRAVR